MTTLNEGMHRGEFLLSEQEEHIISDVVTVTQTGAAIAAGTLMAKLTASGKYVAYTGTEADPEAPTGVGTAAGVLFDNLPAATGDVKALMVVRLCEVKGVALTGGTATSSADLAAHNIIVR